LPGVQTEKTMLAERDLQLRQKQQQRAAEEIREAEEVLQHYESYKLGGQADSELDSLLKQKRAELEARKRAMGFDGRPQAGPGAAVGFDMNLQPTANRQVKESMFAQGGAQMVSLPQGQESERDRRLRLRAEERARRGTGNTGSAYGGQGLEEVRPGGKPQEGPYEVPTVGLRPAFDSQPFDPAARQFPAYSVPYYEPKASGPKPQAAFDPFSQPLQPALTEPRQLVYGQPPPFVHPAETAEPYKGSSKADSGFGAANRTVEDDKKEKQRRYREELDRQQAERRPPRPPRGSEQPSDPSNVSEPPVLDDKREKQRRYREDLDRMKAEKAAMTGHEQPERGRSYGSEEDWSTVQPAPYAFTEDSERVREIEKKQKYAQELREMVEAKARKQRDEAFSGQFEQERLPRQRSYAPEDTQPTAEESQRQRELEKKQRYAQELREMVDAKARLKQRDEDFSGQFEQERLPRQRSLAPEDAQATAEESQRQRETEKKQRYAQELREMVEAKARLKQKEDDFSLNPAPEPAKMQAGRGNPSEESSEFDPALERKKQYKAELERQMEEQRRRREEEKRTLKEKALIEDEKYLADFRDVKKKGKGGVSDPNKTAENAAKGENPRIDPQDRPIGVAVRPVAQISEPSQGLHSRKGLFEPVEEPSKPEGLTPLSGTPTGGLGGGRQGFPPPVQTYTQQYQPMPVPQPYQPANMGFPGYSDAPPAASAQNIEKYYQEIQAIRKERDKAKAEMLELREMMLKEKESRLEDMIKMLTAQAMNRPGPWPYQPPQWPAYSNSMLPVGAQVFPEAFPPAANPYSTPLLGEPPTQGDSSLLRPTAGEISFPRPAEVSFPRAMEASFPREEVAKPVESYLPREFSSPRFPALGEDPVSLGKPSYLHAGEKFDLMEKSMSGTSHFIDPESMQWGTTKLLSSVQKLPTPETRGREGSMEALNRQSAELGGSLPSTVERIPVPPQENYLRIGRIPEEAEEEDPIAAAFPSILPAEPLDQSASASVELASYKLPTSESDRPISGSKLELKKAVVAVTEQPIRPRSHRKPDALVPLSPESSGDLSTGNQVVEPVEAPPRTASASGRNRPKTLDVFKAPANTKIPAKRQIPTETPGKKPGIPDLKPTPLATPKENKPSFHRLQDLRDRKKQEKPRDVLDNLQDELEKLNQQRQSGSESLSLEGSSASQSQFESRFKLVALNELKRQDRDKPPSTAKVQDTGVAPVGDLLDQFVESVQAAARPSSKSSRYSEPPGEL